MTDTTTTQDTAQGSNVLAKAATMEFALPIHFKRWAADSKGHKDLEALAAKGAIADFEKEVTKEIDDETKKAVYKRNTLTFNVTTLDVASIVTGSGLELAEIDHLQELVNNAIKKDIQSMVADADRTSPVTPDNLPTCFTVLGQPYNKRPVTIKVTMEMINAAIKPMTEWLAAQGIKEGGIDLTKSLCIKKFSISALNGYETAVIEKVQGLVLGWFEATTEAEQAQHYPVVNLWSINIEAKLNPKKEDITVEMF